MERNPRVDRTTEQASANDNDDIAGWPAGVVGFAYRCDFNQKFIREVSVVYSTR